MTEVKNPSSTTLKPLSSDDGDIIHTNSTLSLGGIPLLSSAKVPKYKLNIGWIEVTPERVVENPAKELASIDIQITLLRSCEDTFVIPFSLIANYNKYIIKNKFSVFRFKYWGYLLDDILYLDDIYNITNFSDKIINLMKDKLDKNQPFAILVSYNKHINILSFSNRNVWRYDPYPVGPLEDQMLIDKSLSTNLIHAFPSLTYFESKNTCFDNQPIEFHSQDYVLLYMYLRLKRYNHDDVLNIISSGDIQKHLEDLFTILLT